MKNTKENQIQLKLVRKYFKIISYLYKRVKISK